MAEDAAIRDELSALALNLAAYLSEADQVSRLLTLFGGDQWLVRRFDPEVRNWDGYQQDLEAAWDALDRTLTAPGQSAAADPMPDLVRLALVRATLSSADDVPARALGGCRFLGSVDGRTGGFHNRPPSVA